MKISTTHTRPLIISYLAAHATGTAPTGEVVQAVLKQLGGDPKNDSDRLAVYNARHDLKVRGVVVDGTTKGTWTITDVGRKVAAGATLPPSPKVVSRETAVAPEAPAPASSTPVNEVEPAPASPTPEVEVPAQKRRLKVADEVVVPEWYNDPDLRAMVVEDSQCFGAWSARSTECARCYLSGWCRNAKAAILVRLADNIKTSEDAVIAAPVTPEVATLDAEVGAANAPDAPRTAPTADGVTMKARSDGMCAVTGAPIRKGDEVRYVRGTGLVLAK